MPWARGGSSRRRMPFAAFVVAGAVALGGCTGESEPDPSPSTGSASATSSASPSVTPSPSPSVTASGPEIPAAAREQTEAGAEAFVRFFFDQVNMSRGPNRELASSSHLSDPECQFCQKSEESTLGFVADGQRYASQPVEVRGIEPIVGAPSGQQYLAATFEQKASRIVDQSGTAVTSVKRQVGERYVVLAWSGGRWWMREMERIS
jgi:hypothetical protein